MSLQWGLLRNVYIVTNLIKEPGKVLLVYFSKPNEIPCVFQNSTFSFSQLSTDQDLLVNSVIYKLFITSRISLF